MITDMKEVNKLLKEGMKKIKMAIELAKKNTVVGEIRFPAPRKPRKSRKPLVDQITIIPENPKKTRKPRTPKNLPDGDKNNPFPELQRWEEN